MRSIYRSAAMLPALLALSGAATIEGKPSAQTQTASRDTFAPGDVISIPDKRGEWVIDDVIGFMLRCKQRRPNGRWRYCDVPLDVAKKWVRLQDPPK